MVSPSEKGPRINTGMKGSTPVKSYQFSKHAEPSEIPQASPGTSSAGSGGKSVLRTAEEREATRRRRELWIQKIEEEDRKEAEANAFDSPPPVGGRPKTSRGSRNPDPEKFADYVIMSPTKDLARTGEVMQFRADAEVNDNDLDFYPASLSGNDRMKMRQRGLDYDESFGDEASSGGGSEVESNNEDYEDDDEEEELAYDNSYDDNIFTPSRDDLGYDMPAEYETEWMEDSSTTAQLEEEYARQGRALIALALSL